MTDMYSAKWGKLMVYLEKNDVTVFANTADHLYYFFEDRRNGEPVKPVRWSNYIIGRRNVRFDFQVPDWDELTDEGKIEALDALIQKEYDDDELFGFHVEKIEYPTEDYSNWSEDELFDEQHIYVEHGLELERALIQNRRNLQAVEIEIGKRDIDW